MIKSIRLVNWRSHADTKLSFSKGTNLLVGQMGAGKSSVMDAISFALYGTFPALERRKSRLQDLFRMNEDKASVELEFEWQGSLFRIERTLVKGKQRAESGALLFRDKALLESGVSAVTAYITQALGVDYDLFTRAIYSEQNNIDYFLTLDRGRRKEELDALLGLDRFETARANIVSVMNRIRAERKATGERIPPGALGEAKMRHAGHSVELEKARGRLASLSAQIRGQKSSLEAARAAFAGMEAKKSSHEKLSMEKLRLEAVSGQLKQELGERSISSGSFESVKIALAERRSALEAGKTEVRAAHAALSSLAKELGALEAGLRRARQAETELEKAKRELEALLGQDTIQGIETRKKGAEEAVMALQSERNSLLSSIKESGELLKGLRPGLSDCPVCGSKLGEHGIEHVMEEKRRKADEMSQKAASLDRAIAEGKRQFGEASNRLKMAETLQAAISALGKEPGRKPELEKSCKEASERSGQETRNKDALEKRLSLLDNEAQALALEASRMEGMLKKQEQLSEAGLKSAALAKQLSALGFDARAYEEQRAASEKAASALEQLAMEGKTLDGQARMLGEIVDSLAKEITRMESLEKDAARYAMLEEQLAVYRGALLETQASLRSGLSDAINSAMVEVWKIFYPYKNYPSIRLSASDKDYSLEVMDNGSWKPLESIASGGERACAALTLRVALAVVLTPGLSWLVLDEPTHNLDAEAVRLLSSTLQKKVPEVVSQTFVITHDEGLMGADFGSTYHLSRDKSGTGATKAEQI